MKYKCTRCNQPTHYLNKSIFDNSDICEHCLRAEVNHKDFKTVYKERILANIQGLDYKTEVPKELRGRYEKS